MHQRHQGQQEIRGSVVEGSAVRPSGFPNSGVLAQTLKPLHPFPLGLRIDFAMAGAKALTILTGGGTTKSRALIQSKKA